MKTTILTNNNSIHLNDFTQDYIANTLFAIVKSLGEDAERVTFSMESGGLNIITDKGVMEFEKDFVRQMIESTLKGVLSPLAGIFWSEDITITASGDHVADTHKAKINQGDV